VLFTKNEQSSADRSVAEEATSYFELALTCLGLVRPLLIAIGGKSGTGKSVFARDVAALVGIPPGAVILRSDVVRKELFGVDPLVKLPAAAYTPEVTEHVYDALNDRARQIIAQGFSVVIDAAFLREAERDKLATKAEGTGADFRPIFLDADLNIRLSRIGSRQRDASDATSEVASQQEDYDIGRLHWSRINASGSPLETLHRCKTILML
jgi:predicted kinase